MAIRHCQWGALLLAAGFCVASPVRLSAAPEVIPELSRVATPADAIIQNRELGLWDAYKVPVLVAVAALIAQSLLIGGFVVQRRRRQHSEGRSQALLRAMPDFMFLQSAEGVYLDYHSRDVHQLLAPPEVFLGKNMREVLPPEMLVIIEPAFKQAAGASDPVLIEYGLDMPHGKRRYEARLVRSNNDQILTLVRDITERKQAADALREGEAVQQANNRQIQDLAGRLIASQELERARIGRDLHDDLSQQLAALSIALSGVKRRLAVVAPDAVELTRDVSSLQQHGGAGRERPAPFARSTPSVLAHDRPVATLSRYVTRFKGAGRRGDVQGGGEFDAISSDTALCLYRVAQEALRNVITHAGARSAEVRLLNRGDLAASWTIADDGRIRYRPGRQECTGLGLVASRGASGWPAAPSVS